MKFEDYCKDREDGKRVRLETEFQKQFGGSGKRIEMMCEKINDKCFINGRFTPEDKYNEFVEFLQNAIEDAKHIDEYEITYEYDENGLIEMMQIRDNLQKQGTPWGTKYFVNGYEISGELSDEIRYKIEEFTNTATFGKMWGLDYYHIDHDGKLIPMSEY